MRRFLMSHSAAILLAVLLALTLLVPSRGPLAAARPTPTLPLATASPPQTDTPPPIPVDLVVMHTNDVLGYTDPCG
jgi:hypothetical protein